MVSWSSGEPSVSLELLEAVEFKLSDEKDERDEKCERDERGER